MGAVIFSIDIYLDGMQILAHCNVCETTVGADATDIRDWVEVHARTHGIEHIAFTPAISGKSQVLAVTGDK